MRNSLSNSRMSILDLPIEIIIKITKHCDKKTIFNLAITNYRFRDTYIDAYRDETLNNRFISLIYKIKLIDKENRKENRKESGKESGKENGKKIKDFSKKMFHIIRLYEEARKYTNRQFFEAERDYITVELLLTRYQNELEEYYKQSKKDQKDGVCKGCSPTTTPQLDKILCEGGKVLKYYDINTDKYGKIIPSKIKQTTMPDDLFNIFKCFKHLSQCRVIECKIDELELVKYDHQIFRNLLNDFDRKYVPITTEQRKRLLKLNPYHCTQYDWYKTICTCYIKKGKFCDCHYDPITKAQCIYTCPSHRLWVCEYCYNNNYIQCNITLVDRNKYNIIEKNSLAEPKGYVKPQVRDIFLPLNRTLNRGITVIDQNNIQNNVQNNEHQRNEIPEQNP